MEKEIILKEDTLKQIHLSVKWAWYAGILSLVSIGLSLIQLIVGIINQTKLLSVSIVTFLISTAIGILMAYHIIRFSKLMKHGIEEHDEVYINDSLSHLNTYFTVIGLIFIVIVGMILLGIIIGILSFIIK